MKSEYKLTMCRLCLCENQCFFNIFHLNDWHGYIAAEVISNLLQFQVSETDGYPHVVCSKCLEKLIDFKLFKECCQKSIVKYNNMFVSRNKLEESIPEMDIGDVVSGLELFEQDPLRETSPDVTIKSEEVIIDSSSYEVSEDPLIETEVSCGPTLLKYEVLPFSRDSQRQEELIDSEVIENPGKLESTGALMHDSSQDNIDPLNLEPEEEDIHSTEVEPPLLDTVTHPHYLENKRPDFTSNIEVEADSFNWSISINDVAVFEKTKNISLSEEVEASSSGTIERMEMQRILPGKIMDMDPLIQQKKERGRTEKGTEGVGKASRGTRREKGAIDRREGLECIHCGIVLMSKLALTRHMKVHGSVNSYDCAECGKIFRFNCQLKRHLLTHTGSKPHKCTVCSKSFSESSNLKTHMRLHTGSKPYKCAECSKSFSQSCNLKTHMRLHTGSKPYECAECSRSFSHSSTLKNHIRLHTGSKPYKCSECSRSFRQRSTLNNHIRLHRLYKCEECSKVFSLKGILKRHKIIHCF